MLRVPTFLAHLFFAAMAVGSTAVSAADLGVKKPTPVVASNPVRLLKSVDLAPRALLSAGVFGLFGAVALNEIASGGWKSEQAPTISGFWVGAHGGVAAARDNRTDLISSNSYAATSYPASINGGPPVYYAADLIEVVSAPGAGSFLTVGPRIQSSGRSVTNWVAPESGLAAGYNFVLGTMLLGLSTDWTFINGGKSAAAPQAVPGHTFTGPLAIFQVVQGMNWLATVTPRAGLVLGERWTVYATGGLAVGETVQAVGLGFPRGEAATKSTRTRAGWAAGGGVNYFAAGPWILGAELTHADLGRSKIVLHSPALGANEQIVARSRNRLASFRLSVAYRL